MGKEVYRNVLASRPPPVHRHQPEEGKTDRADLTLLDLRGEFLQIPRIRIQFLIQTGDHCFCRHRSAMYHPQQFHRINPKLLTQRVDVLVGSDAECTDVLAELVYLWLRHCLVSDVPNDASSQHHDAQSYGPNCS
jgi:hypothetical protein